MIVNHAHGLHEGVADGGAYEVEASFFEALAHGIGLHCFGWKLLIVRTMILDGFTTDKLPYVLIKGAKLFLHC